MHCVLGSRPLDLSLNASMTIFNIITPERKKMKVAVIGEGTAGCMATAHITKYFPDFELYHIYASSIPTIGVGEGTQLHLPIWLEKITELKFFELKKMPYHAQVWHSV